MIHSRNNLWQEKDVYRILVYVYMYIHAEKNGSSLTIGAGQSLTLDFFLPPLPNHQTSLGSSPLLSRNQIPAGAKPTGPRWRAPMKIPRRSFRPRGWKQKTTVDSFFSTGLGIHRKHISITHSKRYTSCLWWMQSVTVMNRWNILCNSVWLGSEVYGLEFLGCLRWDECHWPAAHVTCLGGGDHKVSHHGYGSWEVWGKPLQTM